MMRPPRLSRSVRLSLIAVLCLALVLEVALLGFRTRDLIGVAVTAAIVLLARRAQ
jgi:hypothetical protein